MGQIRSRDIKKASWSLVQAYKDRLNIDFEHNKKTINDLKLGLTKPMRNRVAGYTTRLMKRVSKTSE